MIDRPPPAGAFFVRYSVLPRDQEPPAFSATRPCVAAEQARVLGQQFLQQCLGVIWLIGQFGEAACLLDQVDATSHLGSLISYTRRAAMSHQPASFVAWAATERPLTVQQLLGPWRKRRPSPLV